MKKAWEWIKAKLAAIWVKLRPGLITAGAVIMAILAFIGFANIRKPKEKKDEKKPSTSTDSVVTDIRELNRASHDAAREAGKRAGREALYRTRGNGGD